MANPPTYGLVIDTINSYGDNLSWVNNVLSTAKVQALQI